MLSITAQLWSLYICTPQVHNVVHTAKGDLNGYVIENFILRMAFADLDISHKSEHIRTLVCAACEMLTLVLLQSTTKHQHCNLTVCRQPAITHLDPSAK